MPPSINSGHWTLVASSTAPGGGPSPDRAGSGEAPVGSAARLPRPSSRPTAASDSSYAGRSRSRLGRCRVMSRPTVQAFRMICRISTPLVTGTQGTGCPPASRSRCPAPRRSTRCACQLTALGLTRTIRRRGGPRPPTDRRQQALRSPRDRHRRQLFGVHRVVFGQLLQHRRKALQRHLGDRLGGGLLADPGTREDGETVGRQHRGVGQLGVEPALGSAETRDGGPATVGCVTRWPDQHSGQPADGGRLVDQVGGPLPPQHGPSSGHRTAGRAALGRRDRADALGLDRQLPGFGRRNEHLRDGVVLGRTPSPRSRRHHRPPSSPDPGRRRRPVPASPGRPPRRSAR